MSYDAQSRRTPAGTHLHRKLSALHVHGVRASEEPRESIRIKRGRHDDEPEALWPGIQHAAEQAKQHVRVHRALVGFVYDYKRVPAHACSACSTAVRSANTCTHLDKLGSSSASRSSMPSVQNLSLVAGELTSSKRMLYPTSSPCVAEG